MTGHDIHSEQEWILPQITVTWRWQAQPWVASWTWRGCEWSVSRWTPAAARWRAEELSDRQVARALAADAADREQALSRARPSGLRLVHKNRIDQDRDDD